MFVGLVAIWLVDATGGETAALETTEGDAGALVCLGNASTADKGGAGAGAIFVCGTIGMTEGGATLAPGGGHSGFGPGTGVGGVSATGGELCWFVGGETVCKLFGGAGGLDGADVATVGAGVGKGVGAGGGFTAGALDTTGCRGNGAGVRFETIKEPGG